MDPLHFSVAAIPLAVYLLLIGILNLRKKPFVTTGARDSAALAIGIAGLMFIGPMKLFFPEGAGSRFGVLVWVMLLTFYGLCVSLSVLLMRARIVIYNISSEHLRPVLTNVARKLDPKSRWTGDSLWMPDQKVLLNLEPVDWLRTIELTAGGHQQSYDSWRKLEKELADALSRTPTQPNVFGLLTLILSGVLFVGSIVWMLIQQEKVVGAIKELLMY